MPLAPLITATLLLSVAHAALAVDDDAIHAAVADRHLIPAYERLATTTDALHAAVTRQCKTDPNRYDPPVKQAFGDAFLAWQDIQHLRFGPIQVLSRDFRFQLWPDKRGSVGKHLRKLLATPDLARLEPDTFAAGSAAYQGFGALERLIYAPPAHGETATWRCALSAAMAANLARMARGTLDEWRSGDAAHRQAFATASHGNDYYDDGRELSAKLLNNLHAQLERLVIQKLDRPLGKSASEGRPKRAEAWRSGLSLDAVAHNVDALEDLYRIAFAPRLDGARPHAQIDAAFGNSRAQIAAIGLPLAQAVGDDAARAQLFELREHLTTLKRLIAADLARALDLSLGFNSLDGD